MARKNSLLEEEEINPDSLEEPVYIEIAKRQDAWTVKREPKLLTPALCQVAECGFDGVAEFFKGVQLQSGERFAEWHELDQDTQIQIRRLMDAHKSAHSNERPRIFKESEKLTQWPPAETTVGIKKVRR